MEILTVRPREGRSSTTDIPLQQLLLQSAFSSFAPLHLCVRAVRGEKGRRRPFVDRDLIVLAVS